MTSELILYRTEDGTSQVYLRAEGGSAWLSQIEIAELFAITKQNVSLHIRNILAEGELQENSVVKESLTTAADGKDIKELGEIEEDINGPEKEILVLLREVAV